MATNTKKVKLEAAVEEDNSEQSLGQETSPHPQIGKNSRHRGKTLEGNGDDSRSNTPKNQTHMASVGTGHSDEKFQACGAVGPMKPKHDQLTQTSPTLRDDSKAPCFTILPTEEDIKQLESGQDASGYIKRPLNAFLVWAHIHRYVLQKATPRVRVKSIYVQLGLEWSKLSEKQKQPYFEAARKLKDIHSQRFPDYEYRPRKRTHRKDFAPEQEARQAGRRHHEPGVSFFLPQKKETRFLAQPGPTMFLCSPVVPYMVGYNPYPCGRPYWPMSSYSGFQSHRSSLYCSYPNVSSSMKEQRTHHGAHLQTGQIAPASLSRETVKQEYHQSYSGYKVLNDSVTSESHTQPTVITNQQLSSNENEDSQCEEEIDVVGF